MGTVDNTDTLQPTINWSLNEDAARATDFQVLLRPHTSRRWIINSNYTREQLCGTSDSTACSFTPASNLNNNTRYVFMVRGVSPHGEGRSTSRYFTVSAPVPGPVTMGTVDNTDTLLPTVNWSLDADAALATDFRVYMRPRSSRQWTVNATYTRTEVCGAVDSTICSFTPATDLTNNTQYVFMIRGQGEYGTGSARASYFTVEAPAPARVTMGNAVDTDTLLPTVNWTLDGDATLATDFKVLLRPRTSRRWVINSNYTREQLCGTSDSTTCSFTPASNLSNNSQYVFMVRGIGEYGTGPARARYFNVDAPAPGRVTIGSAVDTDTLLPTVNWTLDGDATLATDFKVLLRPRTSRRWMINSNYTREELCGTSDSTTCSFTPESNLSNNSQYLFMVRGIGEYGTGPARARFFNVDIPAPGRVTMENTVNTNTLTPTMNWSLDGDATNATDFIVYLRPVGTRNWLERASYTREQLCGTSDGTACSFTPQSTLSNGTEYIFMVRGKNDGGLGKLQLRRFTVDTTN